MTHITHLGELSRTRQHLDQLRERGSSVSGSCENDSRFHTVTLLGEVDLASQPHVRALLQAACAHPTTVLVLETSAVTFIDCAGLRPVLEAAQELRARGGRLHVPSPSSAVARLVIITGSNHLLCTGAGTGDTR